MNEFEHIGREVERQLDRLANPDETPPEEIRPADPDNDTRLGRRMAKVYGQEVEIHKTSNLVEVVAAFLHKQHGLEPENHWENFHYQLLEQDDKAAEKLLEELARQELELMARLTQITIRRDQIKEARARKLPRSPELTPAEVDQRDYWMSRTFDELCRLAPPDFPYPVADVCR